MSWFDTYHPDNMGPTTYQPSSGGTATTEPIKVGQPVQGVDPNNPNAQLAAAGSQNVAIAPSAYYDPNNLAPGITPLDPNAPNYGIDPNAAHLTSGSTSAGSDPQATFMRIMGGLPATPTNLAAKEQELAAAGIYVHRNAEGIAGKVQLGQGGPIVDVIPNAGLGGGGNWQWDTGPGGGSLGNFQTGTFTGGGQYPLASVMGEGLAQPWTTPFNAPDPNSVTNDKALQWQMGRGIDAIQRSAASKGTLLTGGLLKNLDMFGQGLASTYYGDVYNRALGEYKMAHDIYTGNQDSLYNRLFGVSKLGQDAAANVGSAGGEYGTNASNTLLGQGNAAAGGTAAGGAAWGNAVGNLGNIAASSYQQTHQPQYQPYGGGVYPQWGNPDYVQGTGYPMDEVPRPTG